MWSGNIRKYLEFIDPESTRGAHRNTPQVPHRPLYFRPRTRGRPAACLNGSVLGQVRVGLGGFLRWGSLAPNTRLSAHTRTTAACTPVLGVQRWAPKRWSDVMFAQMCGSSTPLTGKDGASRGLTVWTDGDGPHGSLK